MMPYLSNRKASVFAVTLALATSLAYAQQPKDEEQNAVPRDVTYCEMSRDPAAYNHKLVRMTAFLSHGFEDFHLGDPTCPTQGFSVWVMYGGKAQSGTAYCCPGEAAEKTRAESLKIEGLEVSLNENANFQRLVALLEKEHDSTVHGTFIGRFFSGEKVVVGGHARWGGAGHLGCCSLFVIQRVESFEPHSRHDLDYTSEAGWYEHEGCKVGTLHYLRHVSVAYPEKAAIAIEQQQQADRGDRRWAFNDPQQVAFEALKVLYPGKTPVLRATAKTDARRVFHWNNDDNRVVVVVTRPYWLSHYAKSHSIAWVATMVKEAGCSD